MKNISKQNFGKIQNNNNRKYIHWLLPQWPNYSNNCVHQSNSIPMFDRFNTSGIRFNDKQNLLHWTEKNTISTMWGLWNSQRKWPTSSFIDVPHKNIINIFCKKSEPFSEINDNLQLSHSLELSRTAVLAYRIGMVNLFIYWQHIG